MPHTGAFSNIMPKYKSIRRKTRTYNMSKQVKSNKMQIAKLKASNEIKHNYFNQTLTPSTAVNQFFVLNEIATGTTNETRIGNKIVLRNVEVNIKILNTAVADADSIGVTSSTRILLFVDHHNDNRGNDFSILDLLKDTASQDGMITSVYNRDFVGKGEKVTVFYDKYFANPIGGIIERVIKIRKLLRYRVDYTSDAGNKSSILNHAVTLLIIQGDIVSSITISSVLNFIE